MRGISSSGAVERARLESCWVKGPVRQDVPCSQQSRSYLAIITMLPPMPNLIICFVTAYAVMKTPVMLILNIKLASLAVYSDAEVSC